MDFSQEYLELIRIYEDYNKQTLELKTWSVTVGIAAILATISTPITIKQKRIASLVAGLLAIPFWLTETIWKLFQSAYLDRLIEIEECAKIEFVLCQSPKIVSSWRTSYQDQTVLNWLSFAFKPHLLLPHFVLLSVGVAMYLYYRRNTEEECINSISTC